MCYEAPKGIYWDKIIARTGCRLRKQVAKAEWHLQRFENSLAKLEADPEAIEAFRKRRIPKIEKRIAEINSRQTTLVRQAAEHASKKTCIKQQKLWLQEHLLEERKRVLQAELNLIQHLK